MSKRNKTNAMKLLEKRKIAYEAVTYPTSERDAVVLATDHFGVSPAMVYKSLVVARRKKPILAIISAETQLDLKKLAKLMGEKKLKMATLAEAEKLTRLQVGGISPLALLNKGFVFVVDAAIETQPTVFISSGQRGINLKVSSAELLSIIRPQIANIT